MEQRKEMRRRTLLDGHIEIAKLNGWSLDCTVRNRSDAGARLAIPADVVVPEMFNLAISGGTGRAARLVWYKDGQAGVTFVADQGSKSEAVMSDRVRPAERHIADAPASADRLAARIAAISSRRPELRGH